MAPTDQLLGWRKQFPITGRANYLINNSLGAMPASARASVQRFLDEWETRGVRAWGEGWWTLQDEVAARIEDVLGVQPHTVSMHQNVATAQAMLLSCFDFRGARNTIVTSALAFPSDLYGYEAMRARGANVVRVPGAADGITVDLDRFVAAIDDRTLLVTVDHVLFRSSAIVDLAPIVAKARATGAFVVADVFHSAGTVPLALRELGVHAATGGALKWLCGGPGNCFLYVDPDAARERKLVPSFTGWAAHKQPFAFSTEGQDYRDDGGRFATGTPNVAALYAGKEGINVVAEAGIERIRARSRVLTAAIVEEADRAGLPLKSPREADRRGGHVAIDVPDGYAVCQALAAEDVVVDFRPEAGLRIAPHFFNTEDEVRTAVRRVRELLDGGQHERFLGRERRPG